MAKAQFKITVKDLNDVRLKDFIDFVTMKGSEEFKVYRALKIFTDLSADQVNNLPFEVIEKLFKEIESIISDAKNHEFQPMIQIKNETFGAIPNLQKMTWGEYIDLDRYTKTLFKVQLDEEGKPSSIAKFDWENATRFMAVFYRPVTDSVKSIYKIEPYEGTDNYNGIMHDAPAAALFGACAFFLHLRKELLKNSQDFMKTISKTDLQKLENHSSKSGVGIRALKLLQGATSLNITNLPRYLYVKPLPSCSTIKSKNRLMTK